MIDQDTQKRPASLRSAGLDGAKAAMLLATLAPQGLGVSGQWLGGKR